MYICAPEHRSATVARLLLASALAFVCAGAAFAQPAYAETYTGASLYGVQQQYEIETLTETYEQAKQRAADANAEADASQARINEIQAQVNEKQARTDEALRTLYVWETNKYNLINTILYAESFEEFYRGVEYFERVSRSSTQDLNEYKELLAELEEAQIELEANRAEANEQEAVAHEALVNLQNQRAAKASAANATDGANWYQSEEEFIAEWAPRINAYYAGSPMAGTGELFAKYAFRYCIDPRWSPAISTIESSKGAHCVRAHNAWGWGAADEDPVNLASEWGSWEEAINAHTQGLARGYGYTVTLAGAQAYCPSNYQDWYDTVTSEMARI